MDRDEVLEFVAKARKAGRIPDLHGADLHGINLFRVDLSGVNLAQANLAYTCLSQADLSRAYLDGADLTTAHLARADLTGTYLGATRVLQVGPLGPYRVYLTVVTHPDWPSEQVALGCEKGTIETLTALAKARYGDKWRAHYGAAFDYVREWLSAPAGGVLHEGRRQL